MNCADPLYRLVFDWLSSINAVKEIDYLQEHWLCYEGDIARSPGCINGDQYFSEGITDEWGVALPFPGSNYLVAFIPGIIVLQEEEYEALIGAIKSLGEKRWFLAECFEAQFLDEIFHSKDPKFQSLRQQLSPIRFAYSVDESYRAISENSLVMHPFVRGNGDWVAWGESDIWRLYTINGAKFPGKIFFCKKESARLFRGFLDKLSSVSGNTANYSENMRSGYIESAARTWPMRFSEKVIRDSLDWAQLKRPD